MLAKLAQALEDHEGVIDRAASKVRAQIDSVVRSKLGAHSESGHADSLTKVDLKGRIVEIGGMPAANGKRWSGQSYLTFHGWWPFRRGMPPFIVKLAAEILAAEFLATIGDTTSDLGRMAVDLVAGVEARAAKKAASKEAAKRRREERALDRATRRREEAA